MNLILLDYNKSLDSAQISYYRECFKHPDVTLYYYPTSENNKNIEMLKAYYFLKDPSLVPNILPLPENLGHTFNDIFNFIIRPSLFILHAGTDQEYIHKIYKDTKNVLADNSILKQTLGPVNIFSNIYY